MHRANTFSIFYLHGSRVEIARLKILNEGEYVCITTLQNTLVHFEYIAMNTAALHALDTARCTYSSLNTRALHSLDTSTVLILSCRQRNSIVVRRMLYVIHTFVVGTYAMIATN